jgi:hypothetical protein
MFQVTAYTSKGVQVLAGQLPIFVVSRAIPPWQLQGPFTASTAYAAANSCVCRCQFRLGGCVTAMPPIRHAVSASRWDAFNLRHVPTTAGEVAVPRVPLIHKAVMIRPCPLHRDICAPGRERFFTNPITPSEGLFRAQDDAAWCDLKEDGCACAGFWGAG